MCWRPFRLLYVARWIFRAQEVSCTSPWYVTTCTCGHSNARYIVVVLPVRLWSKDFRMTGVLLNRPDLHDHKTWWHSYAQLKISLLELTSLNATRKTYLLVLASAFTLGGLSRHHHYCMVAFHGFHAEVSSLGVAAFIGFAAQANLCRFVSAIASALHTSSLLVLIQVTRQGRKQTDPLTLRKRAKLDIFFKANQNTTKYIGFRRNIVFK